VLPLTSRYMIRELAKPFAFFLIVFTGVIWLTQSLRVIDTVVNSGQGAGVFLQFVGLILPTVLAIVMPLAAFGAALYAINKLFVDSEIVAMIAAGMSPARLARPVAAFGAAVAAVALACTLFLAPTATREMRERIHDMRADIANALIFEGRFLHPSRGLTVYVRENDRGRMAGVFVHDARDPAAAITYTASEALLTEGEAGPRLVMVAGAAQRRDTASGAVSVLQFDELVFDLGQFMTDDDRGLKVSELSTLDLIAPDAATRALSSLGRLYAEGHERLSGPLYAVAMPLVALASIMAGGFARRGYSRRVAMAVGLGVGLRLLGFAAKSAATGAAMLWPLMYAPPLLAVVVALVVLSRGQAASGRAAPA